MKGIFSQIAKLSMYRKSRHGIKVGRLAFSFSTTKVKSVKYISVYLEINLYFMHI